MTTDPIREVESGPEFLERIAAELRARDRELRASGMLCAIASSLQGHAIILRHVIATEARHADST